jgi:hypothetical protein
MLNGVRGELDGVHTAPAFILTGNALSTHELFSEKLVSEDCLYIWERNLGGVLHETYAERVRRAEEFSEALRRDRSLYQAMLLKIISDVACGRLKERLPRDHLKAAGNLSAAVFDEKKVQMLAWLSNTKPVLEDASCTLTWTDLVAASPLGKLVSRQNDKPLSAAREWIEANFSIPSQLSNKTVATKLSQQNCRNKTVVWPGLRLAAGAGPSLPAAATTSHS